MTEGGRNDEVCGDSGECGDDGAYRNSAGDIAILPLGTPISALAHKQVMTKTGTRL
jgi:hypothetical protein